jgi:hypothetical protein
MPKKKDDFVDWRDDWRNCRAKKQLVKDLERGKIPVLTTAMSAAEAHGLRALYQEVEFSKFKRNFEALRKSIRDQKARSTQDSEGLARDRQLHPVQPVEQGRTRWDGSAAQARLRSDMEENLHVTMKPKDLWLSRTDYCESFDLQTFRNHIYKEEQRMKRLAKYERDRNRVQEQDGDSSNDKET